MAKSARLLCGSGSASLCPGSENLAASLAPAAKSHKVLPVSLAFSLQNASGLQRTDEGNDPRAQRRQTVSSRLAIFLQSGESLLANYSR